MQDMYVFPFPFFIYLSWLFFALFLSLILGCVPAFSFLLFLISLFLFILLVAFYLFPFWPVLSLFSICLSNFSDPFLSSLFWRRIKIRRTSTRNYKRDCRKNNTSGNIRFFPSIHSRSNFKEKWKVASWVIFKLLHVASQLQHWNLFRHLTWLGSTSTTVIQSVPCDHLIIKAILVQNYDRTADLVLFDFPLNSFKKQC